MKLKNVAEQQDVSPEMHWIKRGDSDNQPGYVFLNNSPALEADYKLTKKAREYKEKAENASDAETQQLLIQAGFGALRTNYEAFIMFDVFNNVVRRFEERIIVERLRDVVVDPVIVNQIIEKVGLLSRYIEGHLHSDAYIAQKPTPAMLLKEIVEFENLQKTLKDSKKDLKKSPQRSTIVSNGRTEKAREAKSHG